MAVGRIVATDAGGLNGTTGRTRLGVVKFFLPKWSRFFVHLFSSEEGTTEFLSLPKATKEVNSWTIKGSHAGVDLSRIETDRFWIGESQIGKVTLLSDVELWERPTVEDSSRNSPTNEKEWIQCAECDYLIDTDDPMIFCESCRDPYHSDCLFTYEKKVDRGYNPEILDLDARKYRAAASIWNSRKTSKKSSLVVDESELSDADDAKIDDGESKEEVDVKERLICDACRTCRFCCEKVTESVISVTNGTSIEPFVVCVKCNTAAHGHCVFPPVPKLHSSVEWVCDECRECNSCGRVTYLNESTGLPSLLTDWALPSFDQCRTCFAGLDKGEYCPVCMKAWSVEWGGDMVQCDACEFWVHVACDDLGSVNLDKLETDNVTYTCPICRDTTDIHRRRRVTDLLRAIDKVALFSEPVSAAFMPVYLKVIKHPMDLSKMRKKSYANNLDFIRDFELIVENAKVFNMPNSPAYRLAEQFHKQGKLLIEKYLLTERKGASKIEGLLTVEIDNAVDNDDPTCLVTTTEVSKRAASLMAEKMWKKDPSSSARKRTTYDQALEMIRKSAPVSDDVGNKSLQSGAISPYKRRLSHPRGSGGLISPLDGAGSTTKPSSGMASPASPVTLTLTFEELELTAAKLFGFTSLNYIRNRMTLFSGTRGSEAVTISVPADYSKILGSMKVDASEIAGDARWSLFDMCATCGSFGEPWNLIECKDCGQCTHWFCAGLVGDPNETVVTGKNNALRRNFSGEASEFRYTCTSCVKCRFCSRGAGVAEVVSSCCLCGARSHRECRTKYFSDNGLNPNMFRLNFSADTTFMATPLTGLPVCEDCVLSQSLRFFKAETCRACDSLVNPTVASCYFKALPDSSAATVAVPGKSTPTVHCVACGDVWHARCLAEFSDVSASDILGIYVCNACLDSIIPVAGSTTHPDLIDDVLGSMSRVLKQYRVETYKAIQAEFIIDALRRVGGMSVPDRSSPLLYDLMDIFQGPSGNEYTVEYVKLSEKEKQWIEWAMVHKDFFLGLGNPISELSKKKSSSTIGNETSVRIRRIEDEDLLLAKRLHSTYVMIDSIVSGQENVKPEFMDQSDDLAKMGIFPDRLTQIQPSRDFLLSGRSEVGARLLQLWWLTYGNSGGYTGPRISLRKGKGISCIVDQAPPAWEFRKCKLCGVLGDHISLGHLLPIAADHSWVHTECVAWSFPESTWLSDTVDVNHARPQRDHLNPLEFEESLSRMPRNVDISILKQAIMVAGICVVCEKPGATIYCQSCHTGSAFHLPCALSVNAAETAVSTQPRVLMDSRCRMLTCGKCLYRHSDNEKFFRAQFTTSIGGIKLGQSVLDQVWSIRHDHNVKLDSRECLEAPPETGHLIREGTLTIINPGLFDDSSFLYDGSGPIIPKGYAAVRIFWQADLVLTSEDEENGVLITTNSKELPRLRKKRRGAYLCRSSEDGSIFSIQFVGGRLVAIGTSLSDVWTEFSFFLGHEPTSISPEWFFGFTSAYMTKFLGDIATRSIKRQAGLHRDKWMYQPQIRDYIVGVLGLKSELKPITSIRRDVGSRMADNRARIDQLENLGRKSIGIHKSGLADEILEPGLVICEFSGNGEESSSASLSSKPSRIKSAVVSSELPVSADSGVKYKVRSSIPDSHVLSVKRSKIHNYGLFSRNGFSKGEMVVEYQGEVLRQTIADEREKKAEREGDGDGGSCYMFKLDDDYVVDATVKGNCSRFINHSCNPNCTCKMIEDENRTKHIMIIAKRDILPGEEITYDYQFAVESEKLACLCGASNCLGRLN